MDLGRRILTKENCLHTQYIRPQFQAKGLGKLGGRNAASHAHFHNFFAHFKRKVCYTYGPIMS